MSKSLVSPNLNCSYPEITGNKRVLCELFLPIVRYVISSPDDEPWNWQDKSDDNEYLSFTEELPDWIRNVVTMHTSDFQNIVVLSDERDPALASRVLVAGYDDEISVYSGLSHFRCEILGTYSAHTGDNKIQWDELQSQIELHADAAYAILVEEKMQALMDEAKEKRSDAVDTLIGGSFSYALDELVIERSEFVAVLERIREGPEITAGNAAVEIAGDGMPADAVVEQDPSDIEELPDDIEPDDSLPI